MSAAAYRLITPPHGLYAAFDPARDPFILWEAGKGYTPFPGAARAIYGHMANSLEAQAALDEASR